MDGLKHTRTERRRLTRNRMYSYIYHSAKPVSKQQIADDLCYSLPTVHQNIAELLEAKLIKVGEIRHSTGGRPPIGYVADTKIRYSVGISLNENSVELFAADLKQNEMAYQKLEVEKLPYQEIGPYLAALLDTFLKAHGLDKKALLGVGITIPGVIDEPGDRIILSPTLNSDAMRLSTIRQSIPCPVHFENDTTSAGSAEWTSVLLSGEKPRDFVYLSLENGVGGAIFLNGQPYMGMHGRSAEFGHMCVEPGGKLCNCGKHGCLEAYCSIMRITRQEQTTPEEFFTALKKGTNARYAAIWLDLLHHLAIGIHNIRMIFDCDIVLGGQLARQLQPYMTELKDMVAEMDPFDNEVDYLYQTRNESRGALKGASWYFTSRFIDGI